MKKTTCGVLAAVASLVLAGTARAQICDGFPIRDGQGSLGAFANFPSGFDQYGAEGAYNFTGPLSINGAYIYSKDNSGSGDHLDTFRAGAAVDISSYTASMLPGASVCPNVRADFTSQSGVSLYEIPVGLGIGVDLPVGSPGMSVSPYVIPAAVFSRISTNIGGTTVSDSRTDFGIRGGADLNVDRFYFGGQVEWINRSGSDAVFGVRAGIKF